MCRLYANKTLIRSVFSSLESNHPHLIREYREEKLLQKKLLVICTVLSRAARFESITEHAQFTENIVEGIMLLLKCDLVEPKSAGMLISEMLKVRTAFSSIGAFLSNVCALTFDL